MSYWLMKSEPTCFSIDDLANCQRKTDFWDGIRNYQVRNMIRDDMQIGDLAFFYHSSCAKPAVVGIMEITSDAYPDHTALDPDEDHYDPKSTQDNPRWYGVDVTLQSIFKAPVHLSELRAHPELGDMLLLRKGSRLSITQITPHQWQTIVSMSHV